MIEVDSAHVRSTFRLLSRRIRYLLAATVACSVPWLAAADEACRLTLEVRNCSGAAVAEVEVEIEVGEDRIRAVTDDEGRVVFEACGEDVGEVWVYLIEGGAPIAGSPDFGDDESHATARVIVC